MAVVLARSFSPMVAGLVVATFVAYVSWTTLMTQVDPRELLPRKPLHSASAWGMPHKQNSDQQCCA